MQTTPVGLALTRTVYSSLSSSQELALHEKTGFIRCYATTKDVYLRWGNQDCNSSTFDEVIPAGQIVDLVVPSIDGARIDYVNFIERAASAALVVIEK